jgi:hypothetical protein
MTLAVASGRLILLPHPHILHMAQWQSPKREPPKTKAEMREMLAEAVRNTAEPEPNITVALSEDF